MYPLRGAGSLGAGAGPPLADAPWLTVALNVGITMAILYTRRWAYSVEGVGVARHVAAVLATVAKLPW